MSPLSKKFVFRVLDVRELWSLWLSRKMKPYKLWQINSNTNRQYLLEDFLEASVSFQTKITQQVDESQNHFCWTCLEFSLKSIVFFSQIHLHCVCLTWQKRSISIMPFAPDARGDTFKESILAFYSPRRITPVNPFRLNF